MITLTLDIPLSARISDNAYDQVPERSSHLSLAARISSNLTTQITIYLSLAPDTVFLGVISAGSDEAVQNPEGVQQGHIVRVDSVTVALSGVDRVENQLLGFVRESEK